jgi:hypothetical protein
MMIQVNCEHWSESARDAGVCALKARTVSLGSCRRCVLKGLGCQARNAAVPVLTEEQLVQIASPPRPEGGGSPRPRFVPPSATGPGSQLKRLLWRLGIVGKVSCRCEARAAAMDRLGVQWCKANIDTIVGWLREEAGERKILFVEFAVRRLVQLAIWLAARAQSRTLHIESATITTNQPGTNRCEKNTRSNSE